MTKPLILCADGSDLSNRALEAGLDLIGRDEPILVVTVVHEPDPMLVTGTGIAGGVMSAEAFDEQVRSDRAAGEQTAHEVAEALGVGQAEVRVLTGDAGAQICQLAIDVDARGIVLGSRGHGGLRRALLGSVSDHVVRHAHCPVVITSHPDHG